MVGHRSENISIRIGSSLTNYGGQLLAIDKVHIHNNYSTSSIWDNDIAVIVLRNKFYDSTAKKIELQSANKWIYEGSIGVVSGWGQHHPASSHSIWLRAVNLNVISNSACSQIYGTIVTRNMLCAENIYGRPGVGDVGGSFVFEGKLVGVTSWGEIDWHIPFLPIVFTSVKPYINWISNIQ